MSDDVSTEQSAAEIAPTTLSQGPGDGAASAERHGMFGVAGSGDTSGFGGLVRDKWVADTAQRPFGSYFDELIDNLQVVYPAFDQAVTKIVIDRDELTLSLEREHLIGVAGALRNDQSLRFELLSSVSGVDYYDANEPASSRLHSVYHLTSMTYRRRIRLEVAVTVADPHIPSLTKLYPTADWQEREAWDLFGIIYDGHPALTRILMPDDWDGHPQRKDYPLGGIHVQYKGATIPPPDERRVYK
jgi:NADH-quinone oxidoreductase subunit C